MKSKHLKTMKNIYILITIFFLVGNITAQKLNGKVYLKTGEIKVGLLKLSKDFSTIKYKENKKSKDKIKYTSVEVEKIEIESWALCKCWTTLIYKTKETPFRIYEKLMEKVIDGKVSLYRDLSYGEKVGYSDIYFEKNEKFIKIFNSGGWNSVNKTEKIINEYFKDCERLIELRNRKAFEKFVAMKKYGKFYKKVIEIVKFYNEKCS